MMDPKAIQQLFGMLQGQGPGDQAELKRRTRAGQLTFKASVKALKNGCDCEPCQLLREYVEVLIEEPSEEVKANGHDPDPAPRANTDLSVPR